MVKPTKPRYSRAGGRPPAGCPARARWGRARWPAHGADHRPEGVGRAGHQGEEEGGHHVGHEGGPAHQGIRGRAAEPPHHGRDVARQDQAPQQDGAGQGRPHPGDRVEQRRRPAVVVGHVGEREVVGDEARAPSPRWPPGRPSRITGRRSGPPADDAALPRANPTAMTTTPTTAAARPSRTPVCPRVGVHCARPTGPASSLGPVGRGHPVGVCRHVLRGVVDHDLVGHEAWHR